MLTLPPISTLDCRKSATSFLARCKLSLLGSSRFEQYGKVGDYPHQIKRSSIIVCRHCNSFPIPPSLACCHAVSFPLGRSCKLASTHRKKEKREYGYASIELKAFYSTTPLSFHCLRPVPSSEVMHSQSSSGPTMSCCTVNPTAELNCFCSPLKSRSVPNQVSVLHASTGILSLVTPTPFLVSSVRHLQLQAALRCHTLIQLDIQALPSSNL